MHSYSLDVSSEMDIPGLRWMVLMSISQQFRYIYGLLNISVSDLMCPPVPSVANAKADRNNRIHGSKVTYTCDAGYTPIDGKDLSIHCARKKWTVLPSACESKGISLILNNLILASVPSAFRYLLLFLFNCVYTFSVPVLINTDD